MFKTYTLIFALFSLLLFGCSNEIPLEKQQEVRLKEEFL